MPDPTVVKDFKSFKKQQQSGVSSSPTPISKPEPPPAPVIPEQPVYRVVPREEPVAEVAVEQTAVSIPLPDALKPDLSKPAEPDYQALQFMLMCRNDEAKSTLEQYLGTVFATSVKAIKEGPLKKLYLRPVGSAFFLPLMFVMKEYGTKEIYAFQSDKKLRMLADANPQVPGIQAAWAMFQELETAAEFYGATDIHCELVMALSKGGVITIYENPTK